MDDEKTLVQANGGGRLKGKNPGAARGGGGDSGGGAYPNPHRGKEPKNGFLGHGGQTEIFQKLKPGEPSEG